MQNQTIVIVILYCEDDEGKYYVTSIRMIINKSYIKFTQLHNEIYKDKFESLEELKRQAEIDFNTEPEQPIQYTVRVEKDKNCP